MSLSNVKLVVTDMDGTLLNSNHEVSPLFFDLFKELQKQNIVFVVATGRPLYSVLAKLKNIKDDIIIVVENGGLVIKEGHILLSTPITTDHLTKINKTLKNIPEAKTIYCTKNKAYTKSTSKKLLTLLDEYYTNYALINSSNEITDPIYKIANYHEINVEESLYPHLKHLETNFKVKISENHWLDISENNANKGFAIQFLQKKYGINSKETMAFGDYLNDIEMLQNAHYSYAMENAHPLTKETANFTTKNNNSFGVEIILEKLIKAKKQNNTSQKSL